jgi:hypothetical protein
MPSHTRDTLCEAFSPTSCRGMLSMSSRAAVGCSPPPLSLGDASARLHPFHMECSVECSTVEGHLLSHHGREPVHGALAGNRTLGSRAPPGRWSARAWAVWDDPLCTDNSVIVVNQEVHSSIDPFGRTSGRRTNGSRNRELGESCLKNCCLPATDV